MRFGSGCPALLFLFSASPLSLHSHLSCVAFCPRWNAGNSGDFAIPDRSLTAIACQNPRLRKRISLTDYQTIARDTMLRRTTAEPVNNRRDEPSQKLPAKLKDYQFNGWHHVRLKRA
jgi:hypothetical protein